MKKIISILCALSVSIWVSMGYSFNSYEKLNNFSENSQIRQKCEQVKRRML